MLYLKNFLFGFGEMNNQIFIWKGKTPSYFKAFLIEGPVYSVMTLALSIYVGVYSIKPLLI